jgi:reticulon-4-interacting protein 1, mitochondrial
MMNLPNWRLPGSGYPKTCVCDFAGTVMAGGRTGFNQGDEIFGLTLKPMEKGGGGLSELAQFNMANTVAVRKPKEWSHEKAAAISLVWLTAKSCIAQVERYVEDTTTKRVAVLGGSSAVGIYTIMLAKQRGWKVVTTSSDKNKDFVTDTLKADQHVDYTKQDVRSTVGKFAPDAVIDCVGGTECIGLSSSKRYITIVGDKTGRTSMGGPYTYYDPFAPLRAATQWVRWFRGQYGLGER